MNLPRHRRRSPIASARHADRRRDRSRRSASRSRRLLLEPLEQRVVLSAAHLLPSLDGADPPAPEPTLLQTQYYDPSYPDNLDPGICFPPGGPPTDFEFPDDNRWSRTATNGGNLQQGDPTTLTWSLIPDGTVINGFAGEPQAPSNLIQRLDTIYDVPAGTPIIEREWFDLFTQMYASWSTQTGLQFIYEPNDDGVGISGSNRGILGTRGDMRIGGHAIDGNSNILAYNFYPDTGDMVIDTNDSFFANTDNNSIRLRNVTAHETGHGIGLEHVCPINRTKLMEPFYTSSFDGPQHDDVLAVNRGYGDPYEYPLGNDSVREAADVGTWGEGDHVVDRASIDSRQDIDFFRFTIDSPQQISFTLAPVGSTYKSGPQNPDNSCSAGSDFNSKAQNDLAVAIWTGDGRFQLASADLTGLGENETISDLGLPSSGDYLIRVTGADDNVQLYQIDAAVAPLAGTVDGLVEFEQRVYQIGQQVTIAVRDADLIGNGTVDVTVSSAAGDQETVALAEVGQGIFRGTVDLAASAGLAVDNGTLEADPGDTLNVTYDDAADRSNNPATATDSSSVFEQVCSDKDAYDYVACAVPFTFDDIRGTGAEILRNTDFDWSTLTSAMLGDFEFSFYGTAYTSLSVNTNGLLAFGGTPSNTNVNTDLTSSPSQPVIAAFWDDLRTDGVAEEVYWQLQGTGSQQQLVIQWNEVAWDDGDADAVDDRGDGLTFQVVLSEADGGIALNFLDLHGGTDVDGNEGASATVGIKDSGTQGDRRLLLAYDDGPNDFVGSGRSVRISRQPKLTLSIAQAEIAENAGPSAATATVLRSNTDLSAPQVVQLLSQDPSEVVVPSSVTIPADQSSISFAIDAVDDQLLDGTVTVTIEALADGFTSGTDTIDVTDHETITVTIVADSIVENAGAAATSASITRSNTDNAEPLVVSLASDDTSEATVVSSVTIPANESSVTVDIDAVDDALLDGTQTATISATATGYGAVPDTVDVLDHETVTVALDPSSVAENAGADATTGTVTRSNSDNAAALTVQLASADTTEATVPASVTIPANSSSASFTVDAVDDALLDGTQTVTISAAATGYAGVPDQLDVADYETLSVSIEADAVSEAAGVAATTATVTRSNTDNQSALVVSLASNDTSEATVPASVTIPANAESATFPIDAVDDQLLDGTQTVRVTASHDDYVSVSDTLDVTDLETLTLEIDVEMFPEDAGPAAATATITRNNTNLAEPLTVNLVSDDPSEATVPDSVTIPADQASATFFIDAVDDDLLDGTQTVTITATAASYTDASDSVKVLDTESLAVVINAPSVAENAGPAAATASVLRPTTNNDQPLVVTLASSDTSELTVPASVTIPANENSATFALDAVDDALLDGTQLVTIVASADGFEDGSDSLAVTDYETLTIAIAAAAIAENDGAAATTATVTRSNTDNADPLTVTLSSNDPSEATVPTTVTIPANQAAAAFPVDAEDDTLLDGTQTVTISAASDGYVTLSDTLDVTDYELVTVTIADAGIVESAGAGAAAATVTRSNTDVGSALTVTLTSDDTSEATVPASVTIPASQGSASFAIDAVDDQLLDGTQVVTITAFAESYASTSDTLEVEDDETLTVQIAANSIAENDGMAATTATVTRSNTDRSEPLLVLLASSDPSEATVPTSVTIPANVAAATFAIDAVDDDLLDGPQTVSIIGTAAAYRAVAGTVTVTDYETLSVEIASGEIGEHEGTAATTGTVTRSNTDNNAPLVVQLSSSDLSEAAVPDSVTIPAGSDSATFPIDAIDDALLDGTQTVAIAASAGGYVGLADTLHVLDNESLSLTVSVDAIAENDGPDAATVEVARSNTDTAEPLVVSLVSSDPSELAVPANVTIPAGARTAQFDIDAVDDDLLDGTQVVLITAEAPDYVGASASVDVTDYETLTVTVTESVIQEIDGTAATTATVVRSNTDNELALNVTLASSDVTEATVPTSITIPAGDASATFDVAAVDDALLDGTQSLVITGVAEGYVSLAGGLSVLDHETLTVQVAADSVLENAGAAATTATVTRSNSDNDQPLQVVLSSNDTSEAVVPASITIPANESSVTFDVDAVDDDLWDGTQTVLIAAAAEGYFSVADQLDVLDAEALTLGIADDRVSEFDGPAATTATVTRGNLNLDLPLVVTLGSSDETEARTPASITIPADQSSATFAIDAVDDTLLDGTQAVTISVAAPGYVATQQTLLVTDHETLAVTLADTAVFENAGPQATTATITRSNTDNGAALQVLLTSDDTTEARVPTTATIPAGQASVSVPVEAVDDQLLDGTQTVLIAALAEDYFADPAALQVQDYEALELDIEPDWVVENDGAAAATGTVTRRNQDIDQPVVVALTSLDTTELAVPASVTIPAGELSASFAIDAVDDTLLDDTQLAEIQAAAAGYVAAIDALQVRDHETLTLEFAVGEIRENDGSSATTATIRRSNTNIQAALVVFLLSSDTSEAAAAERVTIPANMSSVVVPIDAVDDRTLDGTQIVSLAGYAEGYVSVQDTLQVADHETLVLELDPSAIREDAGPAAALGTITRSNTDDVEPLTVDLSSSDTSEASVPQTVTFAANEFTTTFPIDAVDDQLLDGTRTVTVSAAAPGMVGDARDLQVLDHETLTLSLADPAIREDRGTAATTATLTRSNLDTDQPLVVQLGSSDPSEATVPAEFTIPAGELSTVVPVDAVDDDLLDGTQQVTITAAAASYESFTADLQVLDAEALNLSIAPAQIREDQGAAVATATVFRTNTDIDTALDVTLVNGDTSEIAIPPQVRIEAGMASAQFAIDAVDDTLLDGTQSVVLSAIADGYDTGVETLDVLDHETVEITVDAATIGEEAGPSAAHLTVTRSNTDLDLPLTVTLVNGDETEISLPAEVTIAAGEQAAQAAVDAVDDRLLDGTQVVVIAVEAEGYEAGATQLDVADHEQLVLTVDRNPIPENAGSAAATATVTRSNTDIDQPLAVTLGNSDQTELAVPATVTIPAGQPSVSFAVDALDDDLLDGSQPVTLTATEPRYEDGDTQVEVSDYETLTLTIDTAIVREDSGPDAAVATVRRHNTDIDQPLTVTLAGSDTTELHVPGSVVIPAGQAAASFAVDAVDDAVLDGSQFVTLAAGSAGYFGAELTLEVQDHETLTIELSEDTIREDAGPAATSAIVTRSNTDTAQPLTVQLQSQDPSEASVPLQVVIPAGERSGTFVIDAIDDALLDGTQTVTLQATSESYVAGQATLDVTDHETLTLTLDRAAVREDAGPGAVNAMIRRSNTDVADELTVLLANSDDSELHAPEQVTIPAGATEVPLTIDVLDDTLLDGTVTVECLVTADGYEAGQAVIDVLDYERITLEIDPDTIREDAGTAAALATITRSNTDIDQPLVVEIANSDSSEILVATSVEIPANESSVLLPIDAVDDTLLDGTQTALLQVAAAGYYGAEATLDIADHEQLTLELAADSIAENGGPAATSAVLSRSNTDTHSALVVALTVSDTTEAAVPELVSIPAGAPSVLVAIDAIDDTLLDGTQVIEIGAVADGYVGAEQLLEVLDHEVLHLEILTPTLSENAGPGIEAARVTRGNSDVESPLTITLSTSDPSELQAPSTVTIEAGQASALIALDAVDDNLLDGPQTALLGVQAAGYVPAEESIQIADHEQLTLTLDRSSALENEGAGAVAATVARSNTDTDLPLLVQLGNNDPSEIDAPAEVEIPAGSMFTTVPIDILDDALLDGTQTVALEVTAPGYVAGEVQLDVLDYEVLTLSIDRPAINEQDGPAAATATVTRSNTDTAAPLTVSVASSQPDEASVPPQITIPSGAASVSFAIDAMDDQLLDGTQSVVVTAQAAGYVDGQEALDVADHETLSLSISSDSVAENSGEAAAVLTVTRSNTDTDLGLTVTLSSNDDTELLVPPSVTIPAGSASVDVSVAAVDDTVLDGAQDVRLTVETPGYFGDALLVTVNDHETVEITFQDAEVSETAGNAGTSATVTRSTTDLSEGLLVTLSGGDPTEIGIPSSVTIPAGAASVDFPVDVLDDLVIDGEQTVTVTVSATGFLDGSDSLLIIDNATPWHNWRNGLDVNDDGKVAPIDALLVINYLTLNPGNSDPPSPPVVPPPFYDVRPDNRVTPIDALLVINHLSQHGVGEGEAAFAEDARPDRGLGAAGQVATADRASAVPAVGPESPPLALPETPPKSRATYGPAQAREDAHSRSLRDHYWAQRQREIDQELEAVLDLLAKDAK